MFLVPALVPVTLTEKEQEPEAAKLNAVRTIVLLPGLAEISAELTHVPLRPLGLVTSRPAGKVSLAEIFIKL